MLSINKIYAYLVLTLSIVYTGVVYPAQVEVCFDISMLNGSGRSLEAIKGAARFVDVCLKHASRDQVSFMDVEKQFTTKTFGAIKQAASGGEKKDDACACNISSGKLPESKAQKNYLVATLGSGPEEIEDPGCVIVRPNTEACSHASTKNYLVSSKGARAYCQNKVKEKYSEVSFQVGTKEDFKANTDDIIEDVFNDCKASKPEKERYAANAICKAAVINKQQWAVYQERKGPRSIKCGKTEEMKVNYGNVITCNDPHQAQKLAILFQNKPEEENIMCAVPGLGSVRVARNPTEEFSLKPIKELFLAKGEKLKFREPVKEPTKEPIQQASQTIPPPNITAPPIVAQKQSAHSIVPPSTVYQAPAPPIVTFQPPSCSSCEQRIYRPHRRGRYR